MNELSLVRIKRNAWTKEEDNIVLDVISKCPNNLAIAFEQASDMLSNKTAKAVGQRYYNTLRGMSNVIALGSKDTMIINTKNSPRKKDEEDFHFELAKELIVKLTKEQKKFIVKSILGL